MKHGCLLSFDCPRNSNDESCEKVKTLFDASTTIECILVDSSLDICCSFKVLKQISVLSY